MEDKIHVETRYNEEDFEGRYGLFWRVSYWIDSFGEARGIDRQPPDMRGKGDYRQFGRLLLIWLGAVGSMSSMNGFFVGPMIYDLGFKDSMSAGISGCFVGTLVAAYGAAMGPRSGLRQMVSTRFQFGWWPAKFIALLNVLTLLGWSVVSLVTGGQMLKALNNNVPLEIGIVIMMIVSLFISIFGINYLVYFDRIFVGPTLITFLLIYVCTGSSYPAGSPSIGDPETIRGHWVSFFCSAIGITSTWIAVTCDYFLDMPESVSSWKVFFFTTAVMFPVTIFCGIPAIGIGCAAKAGKDKWLEAYDNLGNGGMLTEAMSKWHGGGKFLIVVLYISLVTNNISNNYSIPLSAQVFGRIWTKTPRYILCIVTAIIYLILALVGRLKLAEILSNFLPMIAYWSMMYFVILFAETTIFRRKRYNEYQWEEWNTKSHFPIMWSAIISFCCGIAGAVIGMDQTYWVGPIAKLVGRDGADMGLFLSSGFTFLTFVPLRWLEIYYRGETPIRP